MAWSLQSVPGIFPVGTREMRQPEGRDITSQDRLRQDAFTG